MHEATQQSFAERAERRVVDLRGFALGPSRDSDIRIADISYTGCKLSSDDAFKPGEVVEIRILKRGAIEAEIRWTADGRAGAQFIA